MQRPRRSHSIELLGLTEIALQPATPVNLAATKMENMEKEKGKTGSSRNCDWEAYFPTIELCRSELEIFFAEEQISKLSNKDIAEIADRYGDRIWCEYYLDDLRQIAGDYIDEPS